MHTLIDILVEQKLNVTIFLAIVIPIAYMIFRPYFKQGYGIFIAILSILASLLMTFIRGFCGS